MGIRKLWPVYLLASLYAWVLLLPLLVLLSASFRRPEDLFLPGLLPPRPSLEAYFIALTQYNFLRPLWNSLLVATATTLGVLLSSLLGGYALARIPFPGQRVFFGLVVLLLLVPGELTFLPLYLLISALDWLDSYQALILPFVASPLGIFLLRQHIRSIPQDYFDAARIDGAGHLGLIRHVALPLTGPALGALAALTFLGSWNMYLWPLVVTQSREMQTAQIAVQYVLNEADAVARWNVVAAVGFLVLLPTLLAFLLAQRSFIRGLTLGGLKG